MLSLAESRARELIDAWNQHDLETFETLLSDTIWWYDPSMPDPPAVGRAAVMAFSRSVLTAFPDVEYTIRGPICVSADGRSCAIPWRSTATQRALLDPPGFAPTGSRVSVDGVDLLYVTNNLVSRVETFFDPLAAAAETFGINLRPRTGSLAEMLLVRAQRVRAAWLRRRAQKGSQRSG
jgi:hypothetical protein